MSQRPTTIHSTAEVHPAARIGTGTMIWNWTKVRENTVIGDNCNIGQCIYIDSGVSIGSGCKIQNGVSVYQGVTIGDRVFVGPNVTFTNDLYPRADSSDWKVVQTVVEEGASIGANATIVCGVTLGAHCLVAAGSVVTKDVPPYALVMGQPARVVDYVRPSGERLRHDMSKAAPTAEDMGQ